MATRNVMSSVPRFLLNLVFLLNLISLLRVYL